MRSGLPLELGLDGSGGPSWRQDAPGWHQDGAMLSDLAPKMANLVLIPLGSILNDFQNFGREKPDSEEN